MSKRLKIRSITKSNSVKSHFFPALGAKTQIKLEVSICLVIRTNEQSVVVRVCCSSWVDACTVCPHMYCMYMCLRVCVRERRRECVHLCVCECVIKTSDFFFTHRLSLYPSWSELDLTTPTTREEISLGINPNWHPWWFFFFSKLKMWECSAITLSSALKSKHDKKHFYH